ncbi:hypothetical protein NE235_10830 [Actinoallomurus spadix]|uniref:Uncharacterized protein n=1 Tax=Actinoallomurus spadix TaxID=79912 RepID=A0ABP3GKW6_9ACTN|nr:hypothetical protein [Actinoallomurus spadix]MCO5986597.1 hypothetical protein [Actinoallomurus spadix]
MNAIDRTQVEKCARLGRRLSARYDDYRRDALTHLGEDGPEAQETAHIAAALFSLRDSDVEQYRKVMAEVFDDEQAARLIDEEAGA